MRFVMVLMCASVSIAATADERYYPTVDAQGRIQVIKSERSPTTNATVPVIKKNAVIAPLENTDNKEQDAKTTASESVLGVRQLDSETYIDTELLEKKNFNIDDKKRFYYLPDGGTGSNMIESAEGVSINRPVIKPVEKQISYLSSNYLALSKTDVLQHFPHHAECLTQKVIKKNSKPFKNINNIWVQPPLKANKLEIDALLYFENTASRLTQLRISSFAATQKTANFYLPIAIFLDNNGCVLSGAWQYWSRAYTATDTQYASVDGLLNVPNQALYVLFYRPDNTLKADIPLSLESGSFVVEAY